MQLTALTTTAAECQRILRNPYRGHSLPCLDLNSRVLRLAQPIQMALQFWIKSKTDLRSGLAREKVLRDADASLRW